MKNLCTKTAIVACLTAMPFTLLAGNKDRTGQAGASELLINPWAQSTGLFGLNSSYVKGLEAMKSNIGGLARVHNFEAGLSYGMYLKGSDVNIINGGIAFKAGNFGSFGFNIMSMGFGDIVITNENNPEGGIGSYRPQFLNITAGYARTFSKNVHAGIAATFVSEQTPNAKATGAAFDAGVQYVTGKRDNLSIGVALRNVGTSMRFSGGAFAYSVEMLDAPGQSNTAMRPTEKFEMPTYLNFGASYDFYLDENRLPSENAKPQHRATAMINFTSNSFNNDYLGAGVEYAFREQFMVRAAYRHEKGIGNAETSNTFYTGISAGVTLQQRITKTGPLLAFDYSFRPTRQPANGVHMFSLRLMIPSKTQEVSDINE